MIVVLIKSVQESFRAVIVGFNTYGMVSVSLPVNVRMKQVQTQEKIAQPQTNTRGANSESKFENITFIIKKQHSNINLEMDQGHRKLNKYRFKPRIYLEQHQTKRQP